MPSVLSPEQVAQFHRDGLVVAARRARTDRGVLRAALVPSRGTGAGRSGGLGARGGRGTTRDSMHVDILQGGSVYRSGCSEWPTRTTQAGHAGSTRAAGYRMLRIVFARPRRAR